MNIEEWFKEKQKEFENDPEYLKEYISLLEEQNDHLRKQVKRLACLTRASQPTSTISDCEHSARLIRQQKSQRGVKY